MALIIALAILVLGVAWFTVGALGKAASGTADREVRTGQALFAAKRALLGYIALKAADSAEDRPGRLPCPESPGQPGTAAAGIAAPVVVPSFPTCSSLGRLPWRTLGIDQLRDGHGEPLWYAVSTGTWALVTSGTNLTINPGLGNQIPLDGVPNAVVALIIAPGAPLDTMAEPGVPAAGCAKVSQPANRYSVPYDPALFLECGNATGSYVTGGTAPWSNDRVITITAAEVMDAIAGPVADRLQRQIAPAMNNWRTTLSVANWGVSFFPSASTFDSLATNPAANDLCGDLDAIEGMPPTATVASASCDTAWSGGISPLIPGLTFGGCTPGAVEMKCTFLSLLGGILTPSITLTAPHIAHSFRAINGAQVVVRVTPLFGLLGPPQPVTPVFTSRSVSPADGSGTVTFTVPLPLLSISDTIDVLIPNPTDVLLVGSSTQWFVNNQWDRFTYYAVSRATTVNPTGSVCPSTGGLQCLTANGLPAISNDKHLVLALMGRPLPAQIRPSGNLNDYLEDGNASSGDASFDAKTVTATFNDRIAACPFRLTPQSGPAVTVCD